MKSLLYFFAGAVVTVLTFIVGTALISPAQPNAGYPERYLAALDTHPGVPVRDAHFEPFINFVTHMSSPDWRDYYAQVYADSLHFCDTLTVHNSNEALSEYFSRLHNAGAQTTVRVINRQISGNDGYLLWEMQSDFKPLVSTRHSHTIGITHLRFDADGRVVLHQDFWDSAQGFYQHLPLLGSAIRGVRNSLQPGA